VRHFIPATTAFVGFTLALLIAFGIERRAAAMAISALGVVYVVLSLYASLRAAGRDGWDLLPALPLTFAVYQAAYATGFWLGLVYWGFRRPPRA
jgi:uncharacterized membrane protein YwaF